MSRHPLAATLAALCLFALPVTAQTPTSAKGEAPPTGRLGFDLHEGEAPPTATTPTASKGDASAPELSPEAAGLAVGTIVTIVAVVLVFNFFPVVIAAVRGHRSTFAIFLLVLFFGWSGVGWLIGLIWSFADTGRRR